MTGPLNGVKIVDISNMLMAPYTTQILGDMGADVIKIEPPEGDAVRGIGPMRNPGMGPIFLNTNRSKRSIVLDLKSAAGSEAIRRLIRDADVLVYNRRPAVMDRLGLSYESVSALNPRIIYAGIYGFGQDGPYAHKPAFDDLIQGLVGMPALSQVKDGGRPSYMPSAVIDRAVGLWAVGQINGALLHQARTGEGQRIDMPMYEMMASFVLGDHMGGATYDPPSGPMGYPRLLAQDRRPFPTADGFIGVMIYTDRHWKSFFAAMGTPEVFDTDPRYANMTTRTENIQSIYAELAELLLTRTSAEWLDLFDRADVPAMQMNTLEEMMVDPHLAETGFFTTVEHPTEGTLKQMAVPATWSRTQPRATRHAPKLGEHSDEILKELGFSDADIAEMVENGTTTVPEDDARLNKQGRASGGEET